MITHELDDKRLLAVLIQKKAITKEQAQDAERYVRGIRKNGRRYIGKILVERGFVSQQILDKFVVVLQDYFNKFSLLMVEKGYLRKTHYEKVLEIKKTTPGKDMAEIIIENGFMGRDSFYKLFKNFFKVPHIGQMMISKNIITKEQFETAKKIQGLKTIEDILCAKRYTDAGIIKNAMVEIIKKR